LWTLVISYIFWGVGTPLSWIILTLYFLRMTVHKPLEREVIVSLLLPIGPLGLSGFSYVEWTALNSHAERLLMLLQIDCTWKGCETRVSSSWWTAQCPPCWRYILSCWLIRWSHLVGLRVGLVCCSYHHDSHSCLLPIQHGVVGLYFPCRWVQSWRLVSSALICSYDPNRSLHALDHIDWRRTWSQILQNPLMREFHPGVVKWVQKELWVDHSADLDGNLRCDVASHCCENSETCRQWQDVFCTMFGYRSVFEKGGSEWKDVGKMSSSRATK